MKLELALMALGAASASGAALTNYSFIYVDHGQTSFDYTVTASTLDPSIAPNLQVTIPGSDITYCHASAMGCTDVVLTATADGMNVQIDLTGMYGYTEQIDYSVLGAWDGVNYSGYLDGYTDADQAFAAGQPFGQVVEVDPPIMSANTPEPANLGLIGMAAILIGGWRRKRR